MVFRWPIEIDGLPFLKMGGSFRRELLNNQMVRVIVLKKCGKNTGKPQENG